MDAGACHIQLHERRYKMWARRQGKTNRLRSMAGRPSPMAARPPIMAGRPPLVVARPPEESRQPPAQLSPIEVDARALTMVARPRHLSQLSTCMQENTKQVKCNHRIKNPMHPRVERPSYTRLMTSAILGVPARPIGVAARPCTNSKLHVHQLP